MNSWEHLGILSPWDCPPWVFVPVGFCPPGLLSPWAFVSLGFCPPGLLSPWDFVLLGFCLPGILSAWILSYGFLSSGILEPCLEDISVIYGRGPKGRASLHNEEERGFCRVPTCRRTQAVTSLVGCHFHLTQAKHQVKNWRKKTPPLPPYFLDCTSIMDTLFAKRFLDHKVGLES